MIRFFILVLISIINFSCQQEKQQAEQVSFSNMAPEDAQVYFISPQDGDVVDTTFSIKFGLKGMGVAPAGTIKEKTGHHHILIDLTEELDFSQPLPANDLVAVPFCGP